MRSYYSNSIIDFIAESDSSILGKLNSAYTLDNLNIKQTRAWSEQIRILKSSLSSLSNEIIHFEFSIPRMGKRSDCIIVLGDHIVLIEFKVGSEQYDSSGKLQTIDYALDLQNFHESSHRKLIVPVLVSTHAPDTDNKLICQDGIYNILLCNSKTLQNVIEKIKGLNKTDELITEWASGKYKPTPTIIQAAQALYSGHSVEDITRFEAGETNLKRTSNFLKQIINESRNSNTKSISFVTGVPGAGKTLIGLNVINSLKNVDKDENAVFLSGNGPLVIVLREALARDRKSRADMKDEVLSITDARREVIPTIQNVHHFRNDYLKSSIEPDENVAVFDEAQRAWNKHQTIKFVKERHGLKSFTKSEPHCLIDYMDRHKDWCSIVCLIGGGQEINTGEAGINEWIETIKDHYPAWHVHYSSQISDSRNYIMDKKLAEWIQQNGESSDDLHLNVSVRSFRAEVLSDFVESLLNLEKSRAIKLYEKIKEQYPIALTRNKEAYKIWLNKRKRGTERTGVLVSLNAKRLRAVGLDSENALRSQSDSTKIAHWFLNPESDIRSSMSLEIPCTEFAIQGLELDWTCVAWGGDLSLQNGTWQYQKFKGSKWQNINKVQTQTYLLNTYRVLLTRARQGMVIFIPEGNDNDITRTTNRYEETFNYIKSIGIEEIE